jgi:hypothetical protein
MSPIHASVRRRSVAWVKDDPFGVEFAEIELAPEKLRAVGVAMGVDPRPYRLDYTLETERGFVTRRLQVDARGDGWLRRLDLRRHPSGTWRIGSEHQGDAGLAAPGGDPADWADALDCDLALSPLTNLMPILRHRLLSGGRSVELVAAWVSVPELTVHADAQRYTAVPGRGDRRVVRYESSDGSFAADITLDRDGIVIDYPGIARRLPAAT